MIGIIDYGVGNLFSLTASFGYIGESCVVTGDAEVIRRCERLLLPGVGAFADAAEKLKKSGLDRVVKDEAEKGKPLLGICLGMQLLFEKSHEFGECEGLGLIKGEIVPMKGRIPAELKIPQIGWNALHLLKPECPFFRYTHEGDHVYFVHSFFAEGCKEALAATTDYGADITAAVWKDNIMGAQFHPEKSGEAGIRMLRAFCGK